MMSALSPETCDFYCRVLELLHGADVPYLIGGAYALEHYTSIERHTKDVDVFLRRADCERALDVLAAAGYETELTSPIWIGKAFCGNDVADLIFGSGNGVADVDDAWFAHATDGAVLGVPVRFCAPEEMVWSKGFIMERERYDGADVSHLIRACGRKLDWQRLIDRFAHHWRVLFSHLVLFGFTYPSERDAVPGWVMHELNVRLLEELEEPPPEERVCLGTLLSRYQYPIDVQRWGYRDGRLRPHGKLGAAEVELLDREDRDD